MMNGICCVLKRQHHLCYSFVCFQNNNGINKTLCLFVRENEFFCRCSLAADVMHLAFRAKKQGGAVQWQRTSSYNFLVVPSFLLHADVDECAEGLATCGAHAQCVNLPGSHNCHCQSGYELGFDGRTCVGESLHVFFCL